MVDIALPADAWTDVEEGTEGLVEEWFVAVGDRVESGQVVANAMLVKAAHEITAPSTGIVESIEVAAGQTFQRDKVLARLKAG